jgi:hypothetical protein
MTPNVGNHNYKIQEDLFESYRIWTGFKDAIVEVTGPQAKYETCNDQWGKFYNTYYGNYFDLLNAVNFRQNFQELNRDNSTRELFTHVKDSFQWPYATFYNCYWGHVTLYDKYYDHMFPHWLNWKYKFDDSYVEYEQYGELWNNFIFNFGFIFNDWVWLLIVWDTQDEYWYRIGYVFGDMYMRIFYRSLYDVPVQ